MNDEDWQRSMEFGSGLQSAVASCMAESGFDYVPHVRSSDVDNAWTLRPAMMIGADDEFMEEYGYGVTRNATEQSHLVGEDPNWETYISLDSAQRNAWNRAHERCNHEAWDTSGFDLERSVELASRVSGDVRDLNFRILNHPSVSELTPVWAECMQASGYGFSSLTDPVEMMYSEINRAMEDAWDLPEEAARRIPQVQAMEVEIASHDAECRLESGLDSVIAEVRAELEPEFISDRKALLADYRRGLVPSEDG